MHRMLPDRHYFAELKRPWKLASFAVGMAWLLYGAVVYEISDWDIGISVIMGGLTYLYAPWSVRIILFGLRNRSGHWLLRIVCSLVVAWFVIDGVYVLYHTLAGNRMLRLENFFASSAFYFLAGTIWLYQGSLRDLLAGLRTMRANVS